MPNGHLNWFAALLFVTSATGRLGAAPLAPEVAELYNLVRNGSFEEGGELPSWWSQYPLQPQPWGRHLRDTRVSHSGAASGLLISDAFHPAGKAGVQWNRYGIPVEGGTTLIASFWVKSTGGSPAGAGVHMYDARKNHVGFVRIPVPGSGREWTYVQRDVPLAETAATIGFPLYGSDRARTWYDDVALLGTPRATAARGTPVIDGRLNDRCWTGSSPLESFVLHTGAGLPQTHWQAWLAYDDDHLYVAFRCPHPKGAPLKQEAVSHDGDTWLDDSVEVFVDPWRRCRDYYQFCVNCRGIIRDSHGQDATWESGAVARVHHEPGAWTVELAIPFTHLGLTLACRDTWGLNLVRNDRVHGETSTWSLGGFHKPGRFGAVALKPDLTRYYRTDLAVRLKQIEADRERLMHDMETGRLTPSQQAEPRRLLKQVTDETRRLLAVARGQATLPQQGWTDMEDELGALAQKVTAARRTALTAVFRLGGGGGPGTFRVAIAHSLAKIRRTGDVVEGMITRRVRLSAARDEAESFQLVVVPGNGALDRVDVETPPLQGPGTTLPVRWRRVEYVETAAPGYPTEYVGWWPDPLFPPGPFAVRADYRQPLWFTVSVPSDAPPGTYRGTVVIRSGGNSVRVPVDLRVRSFRVPRPGTLAAPFGLYASVLSRWYHGDRPYRQVMTPEAYGRWCEYLGRYRLTPKNVAREFISVRKRADGGVSVDLGALKKTVVPLAAKYFAPYSFCLHRVPVSASIGKAEGRTSATDADVAASTVKTFVDAWNRAKLPRQVYLYGYDEPRREHYSFIREAYTKIHRLVPEYPIMQTLGDPAPMALVGAVDIWCPLSPSLDAPFYADRRRAGDMLWTYVCCGPRHPYANFFVDRPAAEHRVLFWQVRRFGATGLLYWCVCYWNGPPAADSTQPCFPEVPIHFKEVGTYQSYKVNGDGWLLYPGPDFTPWPSLRLEIIRDGIEDYEYLALLADLVSRVQSLPAGRRPPASLLTKAEALCRVPDTICTSMSRYTTDPVVLFRRRDAVGDMIERLLDVLKPGGTFKTGPERN